MTKLFRLACRLDAYGGTERPPKPKWLCESNKEAATRNQAHSYAYWTRIYWATPPWLSQAMIAEMREIYRSAGSNHVDHIVPLCSSIVCGLHVPWNLEHLPPGPNMSKSNHYWPGHPLENNELFELRPAPHQMRLL